MADETPRRRARDILHDAGQDCTHCPGLSSEGVCDQHAVHVERDLQMREMARWGLGISGSFLVLFFSITTPILTGIARDVQQTRIVSETFLTRLDLQRQRIEVLERTAVENRTKIQALEVTK